MYVRYIHKIGRFYAYYAKFCFWIKRHFQFYMAMPFLKLLPKNLVVTSSRNRQLISVYVKHIDTKSWTETLCTILEVYWECCQAIKKLLGYKCGIEINNTHRIKLVSSKKIDILPSYGLKMAFTIICGHTFIALGDQYLSIGHERNYG